MKYKIFMTRIKKEGLFQEPAELVAEVKSWIMHHDKEFVIKDVKRNKLGKRLVITIYYIKKD